MTSKCSSAFCNHPTNPPTVEVPAPFCTWCREYPGSGRSVPVAGVKIPISNVFDAG